MRSSTSLDDPYFIVNNAGNTNRDGKTQVLPQLVPGEVTDVIIGFGQSNIGNHVFPVDTFYTPSSTRLHNLDYSNGGMFDASEPLVGTDSLQSNVMTRIGDKWRIGGHCQRCIIVPLTVGGASVDEWAPGGRYNERIGKCWLRLQSLGLDQAHRVFWCWHQGETHTAEATYGASLAGVLNTVRSYSTNPILVARCSYSAGIVLPGFIAAQTAAINTGNAIYGGPNTDVYGAAYRAPDNTHWSTAASNGPDAVSTDWVTSLSAVP